jgi:hypothetical protein
MFVGLHAIFAERLATPELELTEDEGEKFMKSAQHVLRHYSVETTQKTMDTIAFMGCVAGIYGPRIVAIRMRKAAEREEAERMRNPGASVINLHQFPGGAA